MRLDPLGGRPGVSKEQLLAEVEDVLRSEPSQREILQGTDEALAWAARGAAAIERWDRTKGPVAATALRHLRSMPYQDQGRTELTALLYQARADLALDVGLVNVVVPKGGVFDYFDEIRKVLSLASTEVFFVDPYLDAEFVSRYLTHIGSGVTARLLTSNKGSRLAALLSAVDLLAKQSGLAIEVRSSRDLHDRFLFVDRRECYHSGASFKDGAKNSPTALTQITDAFGAMWSTYDTIWGSAKVER